VPPPIVYSKPAALGGSRYEVHSHSTQSDILWCIKKSLASTGDYCGHEYVLYSVGSAQYCLSFARRVCDLPGGFCRSQRPENFSSLFSLRKAVLRAKPVPLNALLAERESTTTIPQRKGVRRWKPTPATMANGAGLMPFARPY